jgi:hypothetical protein
MKSAVFKVPKIKPQAKVPTGIVRERHRGVFKEEFSNNPYGAKPPAGKPAVGGVNHSYRYDFSPMGYRKG